jgi:hypothetical protein
MQIRIIVSDKLVAVDNRPVALPNLDWAKFQTYHGVIADNIEAVQFDAEAGQGHIEFKTVQTKQANRPNMRPPDCPISVAEFADDFAWVLPLYEARKAEIEAEQVAAADAFAKAQTEAEAADLKRREEEAAAHNARLLNPADPNAPVAPVDGVTREELEAKLAEQDRMIAAQNEKISTMATEIRTAVGDKK